MGTDSGSLLDFLTWDKSWKITTFCSVFLFSFLKTVSSEAFIYPASPTTTYLQGTNVVLACRATEPDRTRWTVKDTTLSMDCRMKPHDRMRLQENCVKEEKWFNLTIENLQWEDRGLYTCTNSKETKKTLEVAVPLKDPVKITIDKERKISNTTSRVDPVVDLRPSSSEDTDVVMLCSSGCAFPAPTLRWYSVVGSAGKEKKLSIDTSKYHSKAEDCPDGPVGLKRAVSRLTLKADEKLAPEARQNVTCEARHDLTDFSGGDIIKTGVQPVIYGAEWDGTMEAGIGIGVGVFVALCVVLAIFLYCCWWRPKTEKSYPLTNVFCCCPQAEKGAKVENGPEKKTPTEEMPMMGGVKT